MRVPWLCLSICCKLYSTLIASFWWWVYGKEIYMVVMVCFALSGHRDYLFDKLGYCENYAFLVLIIWIVLHLILYLWRKIIIVVVVMTPELLCVEWSQRASASQLLSSAAGLLILWPCPFVQRKTFYSSKMTNWPRWLHLHHNCFHVLLGFSCDLVLLSN